VWRSVVYVEISDEVRCVKMSISQTPETVDYIVNFFRMTPFAGRNKVFYYFYSTPRILLLVILH
jgi:hypothetical protein